jgi:hypothetical protein
MKTFFAVRICEGSGAAGACACNKDPNGSIIAIARDITANLTFNMVLSFLIFMNTGCRNSTRK